MMRLQLSTVAWKWLLSALAMSSALLLVIELTHAIQPLLIDGKYGSIGVVLNDQIGANRGGQGTYQLRRRDAPFI